MKFFIIALLMQSLNSVSLASGSDLTEYLSPDEILTELGVTETPDLLWSSSQQNSRLHFVVDKAAKGASDTAQTLTVHLDGKIFAQFAVSTGKETWVTPPSKKAYRATTPNGTFRIYARNRFHRSSKWGGAQMDFAQFFIGGIAIHATTQEHFSALGSRDSGGCVRLHPKDAEVLWELVNEFGVKETLVTVFDGSQTEAPSGLGSGSYTPPKSSNPFFL